MKLYLNLFIVFLYTCLYSNLYSQETFYDTTYVRMCSNEIYYDEHFGEINIDSVSLNAINGYLTTLHSDTLFTIHFIFDSAYNYTINASICEGEVYSDNGFNERETGFYTQSLQTIFGCDSIVNLNLIVGEAYYDTIYDTICQGNIYEMGFDADSSGTYVQNLNTQYGCDSILVLHLHVNPTYADTIKADIYKGNVYNLHGFNQKETGVYEQKYQTYLGCDSIIYLDLQVDYIMFPNVVTPNGDGINDIFEIHNLIKQNAFPENELIIYSRQGKLIYRIENIKEVSDFWDPQKTNSTDGTYFYRFYGKRHDKVLEFNGSIEIIR